MKLKFLGWPNKNLSVSGVGQVTEGDIVEVKDPKLAKELASQKGWEKVSTPRTRPADGESVGEKE